jgi:hypothetical protein
MQKEGNMLKQLSICTALVMLATGAANAQQREAVVQRVAVMGAEFDLAVVSAKPGALSLDWREEMDPHLVQRRQTPAGLRLRDAKRLPADRVDAGSIVRLPCRLKEERVARFGCDICCAEGRLISPSTSASQRDLCAVACRSFPIV